MAKQPNEKVEKARSLYLAGHKLIDIANELEVPPGSVRRWKSVYKWDSERSDDNERSERKKERVPPAVKSVMKNKNLTDQEKEFCLLFSRSFNATQSYVKAFGAKYESARRFASRLLTKDDIKTEIDRLKEERYTRAYLKEEDIFQRYMDIAFSDIGDYVWFGRELVPVMGPFGPLYRKLEDGTLEPLMKEINSVRFREASEVDTSLLAEVKQGKDGSSIKLMDRMKALDWLADHIGMATEKQKLELQLLKVEIDSKAGNEEELSKLDLMLASIDTAASQQGGDQ